MGDGHRFVQAMRTLSQTPENEVVDIVAGEVTSIQPLRVRVDNRELTETFLIVGALCKETHIYTDNVKKLDHSHSISGSSNLENADYDIMLWRGLRVGDKVLMLKVCRGQKYYIMQREEGAVPT